MGHGGKIKSPYCSRPSMCEKVEVGDAMFMLITI